MYVTQLKYNDKTEKGINKVWYASTSVTFYSNIWGFVYAILFVFGMLDHRRAKSQPLN